MAIQEQYVLSKDANGDVKLTQNSVVPFTSINAGAVVNTVYLKEGNVGIGTNAPGGKLEILNSLTGHGLYIQQNGVLAASKYSLYVCSNAVQVNSHLVYFKQDNASSTSRVLEIDNDGTGIACYIHQDNASSTNSALYMDNYGTGHGCYIHQYGVLASGKSALYITGVAQTTNSLVTIYQIASSTRTALDIINAGTGAGIDINQLGNGTALEINNDYTGHGIYLHQDGVLAASKYSLYVCSNAVQVNSPLVYIHQDNASSTQSAMRILNDGTNNYGLEIQQNSPANAGYAGLLIDMIGGSNSFGLYVRQTVTAQATSRPLAYIVTNKSQTNADSALLKISNGGAASTEPCIEIQNAGLGCAIEANQSGVLNGGQYSLYIYSNAIQINSALVYFNQNNASSTANLSYIRNAGTGHGQYILQVGNLASGKYALYIDNNGTPVDGAGRALRFDGCTISSTKNPETDAEAGFLAVNIDGTQYAMPFYALS